MDSPLADPHTSPSAWADHMEAGTDSTVTATPADLVSQSLAPEDTPIPTPSSATSAPAPPPASSLPENIVQNVIDRLIEFSGNIHALRAEIQELKEVIFTIESHQYTHTHRLGLIEDQIRRFHIELAQEYEELPRKLAKLHLDASSSSALTPAPIAPTPLNLAPSSSATVAPFSSYRGGFGGPPPTSTPVTSSNAPSAALLATSHPPIAATSPNVAVNRPIPTVRRSKELRHHQCVWCYKIGEHVDSLCPKYATREDREKLCDARNLCPNCTLPMPLHTIRPDGSKYICPAHAKRRCFYCHHDLTYNDIARSRGDVTQDSIWHPSSLCPRKAFEHADCYPTRFSDPNWN